MQNYIQRGEVITLTAPTGGIVGGGVILAGKLLGVAVTDAAEGAAVEAMVEGVFSLPKASADDVAVGDALYWSATNGNLTKTASGNTKAALAIKAAGAGATTVNAKLCPGIG